MTAKYQDDPEKNEWINALKKSPMIQEYISRYSKSSIETFYEGYTFFKEQSIKNGDRYRESLDKQDYEGMEAAMKHLEVIQQKKLFDAQCLWRAGEMEIPEIAVTMEFLAWEYGVLDCPFLPPVTEREVALYIEFLEEQNEMPPVDFYGNWQDYDGFREYINNIDGGQKLPEWYKFHNQKTGNGTYLTYPDKRGELEHYYASIGYSKDKKISAEKPATTSETEAKPHFFGWSGKDFVKIAKDVEDKGTFRLMNAYHIATENRETWRQEQAERDFNYLAKVKGEYVPMQAHEDFREGLHLAVERYKINNVIKCLPLAHKKYLAMLENGFSLSKKDRFDMLKFFQDRAKEAGIAIEEGKRISGEGS